MTLVIHKPPSGSYYILFVRNNDGPRHLELSSLEKALMLPLRISLGLWETAHLPLQ